MPSFLIALSLAGAPVLPPAQQVAEPIVAPLLPSTPDQAEAAVPPSAVPGSSPAAPDPGIEEQAPQSDIVVQGRSRRGDPLAPLNAQSFEVAQAVDKAVVGPVSMGYRRNVPGPIRAGLRNFLANLREPVAALNYLLQLKPGKAGETLGRFALNSTVGVVGLIDVAKRKPFRLPRRRNGFANTLGYYGVKPGPFLFLPLIGATTLRDLAGTVIDQAAVPIGAVEPFNKPGFTIPLAVLSALDYRAELDETLVKARATRDPYATMRKRYLDMRQAEIDALRGRRPLVIVPAPPPPVYLDGPLSSTRLPDPPAALLND